jgi:protein SCO1/2
MSAASGPLPPERERTLKLFVWGGLALVLTAVVAAGAWTLLRESRLAGAALPGSQATYLEGGGDYGGVPDFSLTERSGRTVGLKDLRGHFWIADFIFTRCTGTCPILSAHMTTLARRLSGASGSAGTAGPTNATGSATPADLRFVSFSVDPQWDTPEVLDRYAASLGGVDPRWLFLTGPHDTMHRLIGEGFHLSVAEKQPGEAAAGELITHSDRFVLVDPAGRIRGYYHGDDEESVRTLVADLEKLLAGRAR